jgi:putative CocE/NonD family hydrolase
MLAALGPLIDAGYVVIASDVRGTGFSEGVYDYYNIEGGPLDGYDTVEWVAAQPWCDGHVGMTGASASAIYCYQAAVTHPPHLEAMFVNMHPADYYSDQWFVGGVFRWENRIGWCTGMQERISPQPPGDPSSNNYEIKRAVYESRYAQYAERIAAGKSPFNLDWLAELYSHKTYDAFWKERSYLARLVEIDVPVFHGGVWYDHFIRGTLAAHEGVNVPKRLFVGPGWHGSPEEAGDGGLYELECRWFDHFLRGEENGVLDEPAARLYVYGAETWLDEPEWPVPTESRELFLAPGPGGGAGSLNDGVLGVEPPAASEPTSICHDPAHPNRTCRDGADQRPFEQRALTFSTPPLDEDLEVIGSVRVILYAETDASDVEWCVRLCDVFPDGRSRLLNTGALKGSHVTSHETPAALAPGKIYEFEIEVWAIANLFMQGHRVRIDISNSDFPFFESNPLPSNSRVLHIVEHPSRLVLPVAVRK